VNRSRTLEWDWYPGTLPENAIIDDTAYIGTTFSFLFFRSQLPVGIQYGRGASTYLGTMLDVGPKGRVVLGDYALVHGARIICDSEIVIGDYALISWNVVLMDTYRIPLAIQERRQELEKLAQRSDRLPATEVPVKPIHIAPNVWIGFNACVLPGVTIGEGAIVGARAVVATDVPPFTIAAGNPARVVRKISRDESHALRTRS
jgi:acetyltransferase-like isoleucine patch superfamily enzyme